MMPQRDSDSTVHATAAALLREGRAALPGEDGARDAELLLLHALERPRAWLFAHADDGVDTARAARYRGLLAARAAGRPVAHLTGTRGFWTLDLQVTPATLIPRPETELLVEAALARLAADHPSTVADLGTGTGAIALALASERPSARVIATDASADALAVARANAQRLGLGRVEFLHGDWCMPLASLRCDMIVSNPPYIADADPHLQHGDLRFEPLGALASGPDGLDAIRCIVRAAPVHLQAEGWLLLEHGHDQGAAVRLLLEAAGFADVQTLQDLEARDRVTLGRMRRA